MPFNRKLIETAKGLILNPRLLTKATLTRLQLKSEILSLRISPSQNNLLISRSTSTRLATQRTPLLLYLTIFNITLERFSMLQIIYISTIRPNSIATQISRIMLNRSCSITPSCSLRTRLRSSLRMQLIRKPIQLPNYRMLGNRRVKYPLTLASTLTFLRSSLRGKAKGIKSYPSL